MPIIKRKDQKNFTRGRKTVLCIFIKYRSVITANRCKHANTCIPNNITMKPRHIRSKTKYCESKRSTKHKTQNYFFTSFLIRNRGLSLQLYAFYRIRDSTRHATENVVTYGSSYGY